VQEQLILFNKPYGVISQFSPQPPHQTLADYIAVPHVYPAGRLDTDSEGLLVLTDSGRLQHQISNPRHKLAKTYWVQVEGEISTLQLQQLRVGLDLGDFITQPAQAEEMDMPENLWPRIPPIRVRKAIPTRWLRLTICEGKNRQVRRMTAKVGLPTLRLIRYAIGPWNIDHLSLGQWRSAPLPVELQACLKTPASYPRFAFQQRIDRKK
jgi:23S rRNA pseudouridine2457 synthase